MNKLSAYLTLVCTVVGWIPSWNLGMGRLTIKVPFFGHMTQRLCFCYLPNIKFKWNKFKCKTLDNLNYDNFHVGNHFSHAYINMHKYFGKKLEM
jgi:hypothetical protein